MLAGSVSADCSAVAVAPLTSVSGVSAPPAAGISTFCGAASAGAALAAIGSAVAAAAAGGAIGGVTGCVTCGTIGACGLACAASSDLTMPERNPAARRNMGDLPFASGAVL